MFSLLSKPSRSRKALSSEQSAPAARAASVETLEDRRLYSVSSGVDLSFSWGESQGGTMSATLDKASPKLMLAAVQHTGGANIIAVLIAL